MHIVEQRGRGANEQRPVLGLPVTLSGSRKPVDKYTAALTGDVWMAISHLYTPAEAVALLPAETPAIVREAIHVIYSGLPGTEITITFPSHRLRLRFRDEMTNNVRANTTHCPLQTGVIPRTHPGAFAALITECRAAGIRDVAITSAWRPMLGSIAHRAGLGLDVNYIETDRVKLSLNRTALSQGKDGDNVGARERALYNGYAQAHRDSEAMTKQLRDEQKELRAAKEPGLIARLKAAMAQTQERIALLGKAEQKSREPWADELRKTEPALIHDLRDRLDKNPFVKQTFDPWYMEADTKDARSPSANAQFSSNERLHANHLHLTVLEPRILP